MQSVNDDMDELFRRAAENYPLDTNSANWNKVLAALQGETEAKTISEKKENKNGRLLWLLLLLPLGLICNQLYSPGIFNGKQVSKASEANENVTVDRGTSQKNTNSSFSGNNNAAVTTDRVKVDKGSTAKSENKNSIEPGMSTLRTTYSSNPGYSKTERKNYLSDSNNITHTKNQITNHGAEANLLIIGIDKRKLSEILFPHTLIGDIATSVNKKLNPLFSSSEEISKYPTTVERRKRFYAGVVGGVDATTIKFQKIENAGLSYGVLLGYQLNKKWSIEAGAYKEKKYYYSEGKYFNTAKVYMPPNSRIDNVSGNCKMIEVPVSVKYNFPSAKKANWFSTVGVSTYFMQRENYDYEFYYNNTGTSRIYSKSYYTPSNYFFSNISVSGGYSRPVGRVGAIRIEPYLKIPLSNMGVGKVPLFSTGLQVGITRKF